MGWKQRQVVASCRLLRTTLRTGRLQMRNKRRSKVGLGVLIPAGPFGKRKSPRPLMRPQNQHADAHYCCFSGLSRMKLKQLRSQVLRRSNRRKEKMIDFQFLELIHETRNSD